MLTASGTAPWPRTVTSTPISVSSKNVPGIDVRSPVPMNEVAHHESVREYMNTTPSHQGARDRPEGGRAYSHPTNANQPASPNQPWSTRIRQNSFSKPNCSGARWARKNGMLVPFAEPIPPKRVIDQYLQKPFVRAPGDSLGHGFRISQGGASL